MVMEVGPTRLYIGTLETFKAGLVTAAAGVLLAATRAFDLLPLSLSSAALQGAAFGIAPIALGILTFYTIEYIQGCCIRAPVDIDDRVVDLSKSVELEDLFHEEDTTDYEDTANYKELIKNLAGISVVVISAGALGIAFGVNPIVGIALGILGYASTGCSFDAYGHLGFYQRLGLI